MNCTNSTNEYMELYRNYVYINVYIHSSNIITYVDNEKNSEDISVNHKEKP